MIIKKEDADVLKLPFLEEIIDKCQDKNVMSLWRSR